MRCMQHIADIHGGVLLLREDGFVGLEAVLLQELLSASDLHVQQRVAYAEERIGLGSHSKMVRRWREGEGGGGLTATLVLATRSARELPTAKTVRPIMASDRPKMNPNV